jgi:hypothetical protein
MRSFIALSLVMAASLTGATPAFAQTQPSPLEALEPSTAHAQVQASSGVVFVDLYAEW